MKLKDEAMMIFLFPYFRVFGFPAHYTDVADLSPARRRKLLGKAWSVPVVKHLLSPLRQFFTLKQ